MAYDADGRLLHEEGPRSDTGKLGTLARHTYRGADASNCVQGACDYRKGDLWKSEDALGHVEEILAYDPGGRVRSRRDVQGTVFSYTYSPRGWMTEAKEARPDGTIASTTLTYTPRGDVASVTDADGITLRFEYDAAGRLIQIANPSNHRLRFTLDAAGNRIAEEGYDTFFPQDTDQAHVRCARSCRNGNTRQQCGYPVHLRRTWSAHWRHGCRWTPRYG
jgi:YD repeat-containing protein